MLNLDLFIKLKIFFMIKENFSTNKFCRKDKSQP